VIRDTPNLAARLQAVAGPEEIVIPENTRRLVGSLFEYLSLGEIEVKGLPEVVSAFRVLGESRIGSRFGGRCALRRHRSLAAMKNSNSSPPVGAGEGREGSSHPDLCRSGDWEITVGGGVPTEPRR